MGLHGWSRKLCVKVRPGLEVVYAHNCSYTPVCVCVCVCESVRVSVCESVFV